MYLGHMKHEYWCLRLFFSFLRMADISLDKHFIEEKTHKCLICTPFVKWGDRLVDLLTKGLRSIATWWGEFNITTSNRSILVFLYSAMSIYKLGCRPRLPHFKLDLNKIRMYHQSKARCFSTIESIVYALKAVWDNMHWKQYGTTWGIG